MYYGNNYAGYGYPQSTSNSQQTTATQQQVSNRIYVTSAEDALGRFASPNSIMVYTLQDETLQFEIATDAWGKKTIRTRRLVDYTPTQAENKGSVDYVTRQEFLGLQAQIKALQDKLENTDLE